VSVALSLAFIAHEVHRHGGQERAAAEVLSRISRRMPVTVIARRCELDGVKWTRVGTPSRPSVLRTWAFARAARRAELRAGCTITNAIGAAALDADVITAQFCHAAFTERFGGLRGGAGVGAAYQRLAQSRFVADERRAYGSARLRRVIAVSQGTSRELQEHYGVPGSVIRVVPNGVDHAVFRPAESPAAREALRRRLALPTDACLALFVGGDWERKGVRDAVEAIGPLADVHLVIVGRGDGDAVQRAAKRAGAAGRVHVVAPTPAPEAYYAAADCFVFPSRYEAFSLVTLEAAASGLPIICHAINGTEELIANGRNGWLVPFGADALRHRIMALRDDAVLRARMSAAAVEASRRYAWERVADEYFAVLDEAARERPLAPAPVHAQTHTAAHAPTYLPPRTRSRALRTLQIGLEWFPERPGGLNRMYFELIRHLPAANIDVTGLVAGSPSVRQQTGGTVTAFAAAWEPLPLRMLALARTGRAMLRDGPDQVVVSHFALHAFPLLDAIGSRPLVVHFQGPWGREGVVEGDGRVTAWTKAVVERAVYRRASACIVLSPAFGQVLGDDFGVAADRIHVIPGGVDVSRFAIQATRAECRARLGWPADRTIVLAVRRLARRMGLERLIEAVPQITARVPNVTVLIAGRGSLAVELDGLIDRLGVRDHVRLVGFVDDSLLPAAYRAADLTVVPSVALEGFGLIVAESLAAGTPCLVTPVGGLPDAVAGLSPHLVLRDSSADAIADGIGRAIAGAVTLPNAMACTEFARAHYDWPVIARRVGDVYRAVAP
jgi:glycosyltransferase involved in cell wall biosynthesis